MFVIGNFIQAIAVVLRIFIYFEEVAIIISTILSWTGPYYYSPIRNFFDTASEIVLRPIRKVIPPIGGIDITPLFGILLLVFVDNFLVQTLFDLAVRLR